MADAAVHAAHLQLAITLLTASREIDREAFADLYFAQLKEIVDDGTHPLHPEYEDVDLLWWLCQIVQHVGQFLDPNAVGVTDDPLSAVLPQIGLVAARFAEESKVD